ncbi:MAG: hypothetical protein RMX67_01260 [Planktomarina sp.]|nr:hypothetical protein [Planktomarina sp.]
MSNAMKQLSRLAKLIFEIQIDLGLSDLSQPEKLVLMAAHDQSDADGQFQTRQLLSHPLSAKLARPTFFRVLKQLEQKELLLRNPEKKSGLYSVAET